MNQMDKLMELVECNGGYITTKEIVLNGINKMALKRLCDNKKLERISMGYYCIPGSFVDDYFKILSKSNSAIFSYATSLFLHDLSDRTPVYFDITVPKGYGGSLQNIDTVYLHYVSKDVLNLGVENIKSPFGLDIKSYDIERTICDIIKDKNNIDKEIYIKALKKYKMSKDKDLLKLIKYAQKLNIEGEVIETMEGLL